MHLPFADNIKPERTGHRLPKREPARPGLYAEQDASLCHDVGHEDVWRTEVRIVCQTPIDTRTPTDLIERIHKDTKGKIMHHVYGPIYDELLKVMDVFYNQGVHRGDPAFDHVDKMMETLENAFRGEC